MNYTDKQKIDTLIISDTHLGDTTTRSDEILDVLRKYDYQRLILNGDILNGLKFNRLNTKHWEVLSKLRKLSATCEVVWVHGNHDASSEVLSNLLGLKVYSYYQWKSNGLKFIAIHGHQFDLFLINNYILSQIAYKAYDFLKKFRLGRSIAHYLKDNNQTWKRNSRVVAKKAIQLARFKGVDFIFCGHTHKMMEKKKKNVIYINTASWNEKPSGFVTIKDKLVKLNKYD